MEKTRMFSESTYTSPTVVPGVIIEHAALGQNEAATPPVAARPHRNRLQR
jgi:hypothetical protein